MSNDYETLRRELLPKPKFVFRRYRHAWAGYNQNRDQTDESTISECNKYYSPVQKDNERPEQSEQMGLCNIEHSNVRVLVDGTVHINDTPIGQRVKSGQAVVLRIIKQCSIELYVFVPVKLTSADSVDTLPSQDTSVVVKLRIASYVHVTDCRRMELQLSVNSCDCIRPAN